MEQLFLICPAATFHVGDEGGAGLRDKRATFLDLDISNTNPGNSWFINLEIERDVNPNSS